MFWIMLYCLNIVFRVMSIRMSAIFLIYGILAGSPEIMIFRCLLLTVALGFDAYRDVCLSCTRNQNFWILLKWLCYSRLQAFSISNLEIDTSLLST